MLVEPLGSTQQVRVDLRPSTEQVIERPREVLVEDVPVFWFIDSMRKRKATQRSSGAEDPQAICFIVLTIVMVLLECHVSQRSENRREQ